MWCATCTAVFTSAFVATPAYTEATGRKSHTPSPWESSTLGCRTLRLASVEAHERVDGPHAFIMNDRKKEPAGGLSSSMKAAKASAANTTPENAPFFSLFTNAHVVAQTNLSAKTFVALNDADRRKGAPVLNRCVTRKCAFGSRCKRVGAPLTRR